MLIVVTIFVMLWPVGSLASADFRLPSTLSVNASGGQESSGALAMDLGLSLQNGLQLMGGLDLSRVKVDADDVRSSGVNLGVGTNPLDPISGLLRAEAYRSGDTFAHRGASAALTWMPNRFAFTVEPGARQIELKTISRPLIPSRTIETQSQSLKVLVEFFASRLASFRFFVSRSWYEDDLSFLTRDLAQVLVSQDALMASMSLVRESIGVGVSTSMKNFAFHLDTFRTTAEADRAVIRNLSGTVAYRFNRKWAASLNTLFFRQDNDEVSQSGSVGVTLSW